MRELSIDLDPEIVEALAAEGAAAGFEDPADYVRWLVDNRDAVEEAPERDHLLEAYRERFVELKRETDAAGDGRGAGDGDVGPTPRPEEPPAARGSPSGRVANTDGGRTMPAGARSDDAPASPASPPTPEAGPAEPGPDREPIQDRSDADTTPGDAEAEPGPDREEAEPTQDRSDADTAPDDAEADRAPDDGGRSAGDPEGPSDADDEVGGRTQSSVATPEEGFGSINLQPERVTRIEGDPIGEDADVLGSVETRRVDELSRRAVAKTRKRLNRDVETGLEYASSTGLSDEGIPLGEDIVDLESLEVPARTAAETRSRRAVAGKAIAMLRDERRARKSDFVDALYEDHPAGYDSPDSWWRCVKTALAQVETIEGGHVWQFSG